MLVETFITVLLILQENLQQQMEELTRIQTAQKDIYKKKEVDDLLNAVKQLMY